MKLAFPGWHVLPVGLRFVFTYTSDLQFYLNDPRTFLPNSTFVHRLVDLEPDPSKIRPTFALVLKFLRLHSLEADLVALLVEKVDEDVSQFIN